MKRNFRMVSLDDLYETERTEGNLCLQLCICLWSLALRKHHEKSQNVCRRVVVLSALVWAWGSVVVKALRY